MHPNIVQAHNVLNDSSLTPAYARRKALALLRNVLWVNPPAQIRTKLAVEVAILCLEGMEPATPNPEADIVRPNLEAARKFIEYGFN